MFQPFDSHEGNVNVVYRDLLLLLVLVGFTLFIIISSQVSSKNKNEQDAEQKILGSLVAEIAWPQNQNNDIDLWIKAPDQNAVGYSNKSAGLCDLVRDDLGITGDPMPGNYENIFCRGLVPGEYRINVFYYNNKDVEKEVPVMFSLKIKFSESKIDYSYRSEIFMTRRGQEITLVSFTVLEDGTIDPKSVNNIQKSILRG